MRCRHTTVRDTASADSVRVVLVDARHCMDCGEAIGMGDAAADTPEVELEKDVLINWLPDAPFAEFDGLFYRNCDCRGCQKRHLANVIAAHDGGA